MRHPSHTVDDYLQAIYSLQGEGERVTSARLARRMGVTPPTAWGTIQRMARDGFVSLDERKIVHFTIRGRKMAEDIVRRHRLAERFLCDVLGLGWAEVHKEAHAFEHAITPRLEPRIAALAGNPTTCPHGSPIPGAGARLDAHTAKMSSLETGDEAEVRLISEEMEEDTELMRYLERGRIMPGHRVRVVEKSPSTGVVILDQDGLQVSLGLTVAERIRVQPLSLSRARDLGHAAGR